MKYIINNGNKNGGFSAYELIEQDRKFKIAVLMDVLWNRTFVGVGEEKVQELA